MKRPTNNARNKGDDIAERLESARLQRGYRTIELQRQSYAIGSAALENSLLTRSSVAALSQDASPHNAAEIEVKNLANLYDFVIENVEDAITGSTSGIHITPELIRRAHKIAMSGLTVDAGRFRNSPVAIAGSVHLGPESESVPQLVNEYCSYINSKWEQSSALHLAAYALWRLLWIHPFLDANGRVARTISYLVLSARLGAVLPGTPTLPALIAQEKQAYYAGLEIADRAAMKNKLDLIAIEHFLFELLSIQLQSIAILPSATDEKLEQTIGIHLQRASPELKRKLYGDAYPHHQLWSHGVYLVLHICGQEELDAAHNRQKLFGEPFPGLLSSTRERATNVLPNNPTIHFLENAEMEVSSGGAVFLPADGGLILTQSRCRTNYVNYFINGTLYCVRLGAHTTEENCDELIELLLARHLMVQS